MKNKLLFTLLLAMVLLGVKSFAQTQVSSLNALKPYLDDDNVDIVLTPGDYYVTASDVSSGTVGDYWTGSEHLGNSYNVFLFEGDNSTYDFTGVTIYIETETAQSVGSVDFYEVRIIGNNNTISNLTVVDDGDEDDAPTSRATNVVMDGANNVIESCHFTVKGSHPYGYGDIFGKGGSNIISHNKRSACLVRGNSNSVLNSTFICRSYGHGIFFQGANDPYVDGCYVEGELRSTDDVLAEDGSGSPADNVDFETIFGFNMSELVGNYYFSCQEDGIRSYNAGETVIDGVEYDRGVTNAIVTNSTVVKMRSGVTIGWASGTKYVENCYTYACEIGYWVGSNTNVVDSYGDASIGSLLSEDAERSNATIELTILDNYVTPLDGEVSDIYYAGSGHNVTIHDGTTSFDNDIEFILGGERLAHRFLAGSDNEPLNFDASDITFVNNSSYPIYVGDKATDLEITTCGTVSDDGSGTSITYNADCNTSFTPDPNKTYYIDCPHHDLRIAASGESEDPYTTSTSTTGDDVEWKFTDKGNGYWHIDRAAGGSTSRLRSDNSEYADMNSTSSSGTYTYYDFSTGSSSGTYFLTLPNGPSSYNRLQVNSSGEIKMVTTSSDGTWESFTITEVESTTCTESNLALCGMATQSSTEHNGEASLAIDGDTNGVWSGGSVTHTSNEANAWWEVELDGTYNIGVINVYGRTDCCEDRMDNFTVSVINASGSTTYSQSYTSYPDPSITLDANGAVGNTIRVQLDDTERLSLAEIEVYEGAENCATFSTIQAEDFDGMSGVVDEGSNVGFIQNGDWAMYSNVDLTCASSIDVNTSSPNNGGEIEVRLGSSTGTLIGTITIAGTGSWNTWVTSSSSITNTSGEQDIYLVFTGDNGYLFNLDWIEFSENSSARLTDFSTEQNELDAKISIFPNPMSNNLTVMTPQSIYNSFAIHNINGKVVRKGNLISEEKEISINVSNLDKGFFVLILSGENSYKTFKLIKE